MSNGQHPPPWSPPLDRPGRVLIVKLSALGDVLHALPVLAALRRAHPALEVDWVVEDRAADVVVSRPELAEVIVVPRRAMHRPHLHPARTLRAAKALVRRLRAREYDVALDLQGNLKSGVVTRLSGAPLRYGFTADWSREANHLFTNRHVRPPARVRHRVDRNLALLAAFLGRDPGWVDPGWPPRPGDEARGALLLTHAGLPSEGFVLLHPGTSRFGAFKRWPPSRFADLARMLRERGRQAAVVAPPGEEALALDVERRAGGAATVLHTPDLHVLADLIRRAACYVGADSGPLHLAALTGTPVLGLFGPKDPRVHGPYGRRADGRPGLLPVLTHPDAACRPCSLRRCPDPVCMTGLTAEAALAAIEPVPTPLRPSS